MKNKIISKAEALKLLNKSSNEFAYVPNPSFIHPPFELYPLSKKLTKVSQLKAVVMDMDGTTTTTEELCIHSLEYMVRKITGRMSNKVWAGLDHVKDFPHIIGNSTTKHVEYLISTYQKNIKKDELKKSFIYAALWTLFCSRDEGRRKEVLQNLMNLECSTILNDKEVIENINNYNLKEEELNKLTSKILKKYKNIFKAKSFSEIVKAAVDIYYQRYHEILVQIDKGQGDKLSKELLGSEGKKLIEPMKGVGVFLALIKGLLGKEISTLLPYLDITYNHETEKQLLDLSKFFQKNPAKVAVVTSSIYYEANIVMKEVFSVLKNDVMDWNISAELKRKLIEFFSSYKNAYDGFVTATDSNEIRLKPHRDLYSIALHQLGISKEDFNKVMGLEDSESGTFAIRAAGIGLCVAVPFAKTSGHNLDAASYIANDGLPEIIIKKKLFIK